MKEPSAGFYDLIYFKDAGEVYRKKVPTSQDVLEIEFYDLIQSLGPDLTT